MPNLRRLNEKEDDDMGMADQILQHIALLIEHKYGDQELGLVIRSVATTMQYIWMASSASLVPIVVDKRLDSEEMVGYVAVLNTVIVRLQEQIARAM